MGADVKIEPVPAETLEWIKSLPVPPDTRRVLRVLARTWPTTVDALARTTRLSPEKVRAALAQLDELGLHRGGPR